MNVIFNLLIKIAIMVFLGYFLKKKNIITEEVQKGLSDLLLKAVLPFNILASSSKEYSKELATGLMYMFVIVGIYYIFALVVTNIISRKMNCDRDTKKVFITLSTFANVGFLGFPLAQELFGGTGVLYTVVYNFLYQILMFTYGINLLSSNNKFEIKRLFNPVAICSLFSISIYLSPFRFPLVLSDTFKTVGDMMVPLSMIVLGCSLYGMNLKEILTDKYSYLVSFLRLIFFPLIMGICLYPTNVPMDIKALIIILTALPSGSLNVIFAQSYNTNPNFATRAVIQTMLFTVIILPLIIICVNFV